VTGLLDLTGISLTGGFTIDVIGLDSLNELGNPVGYAPQGSYLWEIARADEILGFDASMFTINSFNLNSQFEIIQAGNSLFLSVTPVPEPATGWLLMVGAMGASFLRGRRQVNA